MITAQAAGRGLMTQEGHDRLRRELEILKTSGRQKVAARLRDARADGGDAAGNSEIVVALDEQALLDRRISGLERRLASARIVDAATGGTAGVGSLVRLRTSTGGIVAYELVGAGEADPADGRISIESPVGQAIAGRRAGDTVELQTPRRVRRLELVSVGPADGEARVPEAA